MHKNLAAALVAAAVLLVAPLGAAEFNPIARRGAEASPSVAPYRLLIKLRGAAGLGQSASPADRVQRVAGRMRLPMRATRELGGNWQILDLPQSMTADSMRSALSALRADRDVETAVYDYRRHALATPTDPRFTGQWYLQNATGTPSAINAVEAWDVTPGGSGVVIAVLDSGVRFDHPDLLRANQGGRLLPGYDFVSTVAVANDGDGRDADPSDPGDWVTSADTATQQFSTCDVADSSWHGTRVSGIIGALAQNQTGISGINWRGWILPVRVLGKCGGFDSDIATAMMWAGGMHVAGVPDNPYPAKIINLSLGGPAACASTLYPDAISQLAARGVLVVASAGNDGGPVETPAQCAGVAAIAGLRHAGTKVGYSNLGPEIALGAPAGNCPNSLNGTCQYSIDTTFNLGTTVPTTNGYTDQGIPNIGTSFASPIVSGIAGLMLSVNGNLGPAQLIARLQEGARKPFPKSIDPTIPDCHVPTGASDKQGSECNCTTQTCGAGMANAKGAVIAAMRPIAAMTVPASISAGQNFTLMGHAAAACGSTVATYQWSVVSMSNPASPPGLSGENTANVSTTAPASGDSYVLRLTITDDMGRQDTADVTVTSTAASTTAPATVGVTACLATVAGLPTISVSPATASLAVGKTQSFTTSLAASLAVWKVNGVLGGNSTLGTITTSGVYTAPAAVPTPAAVTISAESSIDATRSGSAQATVQTAAMPTPSSSGSPGGGGGGGAVDYWLLAMLGGAVLLRVCARADRGRPPWH